jgi:hypothetical protein
MISIDAILVNIKKKEKRKRGKYVSWTFIFPGFHSKKLEWQTS